MSSDWLGRGRPRTEEKVIDGVIHKHCLHCDEFKPRDTEFWFNPTVGHYQPPCRECRKIRHRIWSQENKEHVNAKQRERRQRAREAKSQ